MDRVDFSKILALLVRISESLYKLISQSKSNWDADVNVDFHFIKYLPAELAVRHSLVCYEICPAENDFDILPQKRVVVLFHYLQTDVDDLLQLLTAHVVKTAIGKQYVSKLTSVQRFVECLSVAESITFQHRLQQKHGILENWLIHFWAVDSFGSCCVKLRVFLVKEGNEVILEVVIFFGWLRDVRQCYDFSFVKRRVELEDLADLRKWLTDVLWLALSKD